MVYFPYCTGDLLLGNTRLGNTYFEGSSVLRAGVYGKWSNTSQRISSDPLLPALKLLARSLNVSRPIVIAEGANAIGVLVAHEYISNELGHGVELVVDSAYVVDVLPLSSNIVRCVRVTS